MKKIMQAIILLVSINSITAQKIFENKKFGISMQEPKNWNVANNDEYLKNFERIDLTDEKLAELIDSQKGSLQLTTFYKYDPNKYAGVIPTITISIDKIPTEDFEEFKNVIKKSIESYKKYVIDFEFVEEPKEVEISKNKGVFCIYKYSVKTLQGEILEIRSRDYNIPNGNYQISFTFMDGEANEDCSKEFNEIIKTIQINWNE